MNITVDISGPAFDDIAALARSLARPRGLLRAVQQGVAQELVEHFDRRNSEGNKQGWPSRNFWAGVADRVGAQAGAVSNTEAAVTIASPELAHKITGGVITPQRGSALAIPASAEAYAAGSPREGGAPELKCAFVLTDFGYRAALVAVADYLRRVQRGKNAGGLVRAKAIKGKDGSRKEQKADLGKGAVWYWLIKSANQPADPRAMPTNDELGAAAQTAANDWLSSLAGDIAQEGEA